MDDAPSAAPKHRPPFWHKRVLAAYLRMLGATQKDAGAAVGRAVRTIRSWEEDRASWEQARHEAAAYWLNDVVDASRATVLNAVRAGDAEIGLKILERTIEALAPPKTRVEVHIPWDSLSDEQLRRLAAGEDAAKVVVHASHNGQHPG